jgi:DNA-binding XRE family transcriptional regulator
MTGFVYAIAAGHLIKIGWSSSPRRRFHQIATHSPVKPVFLGVKPGSRDDEAATHSLLRKYRAHGEWFWRSPDVDAFVAGLTPPAPLRKHRRPKNKLGEYIRAQGITRSEFARRMGVSAQAVNRYCDGDRIPRLPQLRKIYELTGGDVTPNDFYCGPSERSAA